MIIIPFLDICR